MPHIPTAICVPCAREYKPFKNGFEVRMMVEGQSYYQVSADVWICPSCGHKIVVGFGQSPYWQNYFEEGPPDYDLEAEFA